MKPSRRFRRHLTRLAEVVGDEEWSVERGYAWWLDNVPQQFHFTKISWWNKAYRTGIIVSLGDSMFKGGDL